jgi:hypothetical protein
MRRTSDERKPSTSRPGGDLRGNSDQPNLRGGRKARSYTRSCLFVPFAATRMFRRSPPSTDARTNLGCSAREATQRIEHGGRHGSVTEDVEAQAPHLSHALNEPRDRKVGMAAFREAA